MALKAQQSEILVQALSGGPLAAIEEVQNITGPDGKAKLIDTTHLKSTGKEYLSGLADFGQISLDMNYAKAASNTQQQFLRTMYATQDPGKLFRIHIPDTNGGNHTFSFTGIVTSWNLDLKTDDKASLKATIQVTGSVTYTAPLASP